MSDTHEVMLELTADIVSAYVGNNSVPLAELPDLISGTHAALTKLGKAPEVQVIVPVPATSIKKSITADYLICLDDGKKFKSLRRHLATLGMTPEQYRKKWDLPADYPMVSPAYAEQRSVLAKEIGLGRKSGRIARQPEPAIKPKRGRPAKAALSA